MREVRVCWVDSRSEDAWTLPDDLKPKIDGVTTLGYLAKETEQVVSVASSVDLVTGQVCCVMHIPKVCILSMEDVPEMRPPDDPTNGG